MRCLPEVHVGRPDTVQLSGSTTLKSMKAVYTWTVSGFEICPEDSVNIMSPIFSHPNSSKWCTELENDAGKLMMCFHLVTSNDSMPVTATLQASLLNKDGEKDCVYPADVHNLKINERSPRQCLTDTIDEDELGENWTFECEVCTVEVVTEDTSGVSDEEVYLTLGKNLEHLLKSKDFADITLSVGGVQLEAHRVILCARSPVFRAMLSHDTKEARDGVVEILDMQPEAVSEMLSYMYTDRVQVPRDTTEQLLMACDKYGLQDGKLKCELELARHLTVDTAANTAAFAIVHSCSFLQKVCVAFIEQNLEQVIGTKGWADIIDKCPKTVKTICELVTKGSESCSSPPATYGSQLDVSTVNSSVVESMSKNITPETYAVSSDTVWDTGYTQCGRKKVIYVWKLVGLTNWSQGRDFVASPSFWHPETIQWEVRLYKSEKEYKVCFKVLENKAGGSVRADMGISIIRKGGNSKMCVITDTIEKGSLSKSIFWPVSVSDTLTLKCEISMVCVLQQCVIAIKPMLQSGLREDLNSLLKSGNLTDFKLRAGTVEMGAHRVILAARSPFFAHILQSGSEESKVGQLELPDVKPEVLSEILLYIYTGKVKNLENSTAELLAAAHKFELCHLERKCITHLSKKLTVDNAVDIAVCAIENQSDVLLNISLKFIRLHVKQVMGTNQWIEAIDRHPAALKRISQLVAESEM